MSRLLHIEGNDDKETGQFKESTTGCSRETEFYFTSYDERRKKESRNEE